MSVLSNDTIRRLAAHCVEVHDFNEEEWKEDMTPRARWDLRTERVLWKRIQEKLQKAEGAVELTDEEEELVLDGAFDFIDYLTEEELEKVEAAGQALWG